MVISTINLYPHFDYFIVVGQAPLVRSTYASSACRSSCASSMAVEVEIEASASRKNRARAI
jgi:hypothetical protein